MISPSRERAGVRVTQGLDNSFEHCLRVPQYIMVPKAQHSITLFLKEASPLLIRCNPRSVLPAIQLHY
jgi:hypothetical protein